MEDADAPADAHVEHDEDGHGAEARRRQRVKLQEAKDFWLGYILHNLLFSRQSKFGFNR